MKTIGLETFGLETIELEKIDAEMVADTSPHGNYPAPAHSFALRLDEELALRLLEGHHAGAHYRLVDADREHLSKWFRWAKDASKESTTERIANSLQRFAAGDGWRAELCWRSEPVGSVWLHGYDGPGGSTEIGYWLAKGHEGRGLMTRTLRGLLRHFFEGRALERVSIGLDPRNERSLRVVRRLGLRPEAVLRRVLVDTDDAASDLAMFGLLRDEWDGASTAADAPPPTRFCLEIDADDELYLALFERDDADDLAALVAANTEHLRPWMPWLDGQGPESQRAFIVDRALPAFAAGNGSFEAGIWSQSRLVGAAGIHSVDERNRSGMVGYWLDAAHSGRGVVTRVVRGIVERCFSEPIFEGGPFERLEIAADVDNLSSRAVAERLGFTFEGVLRKQPFDGKRYIDLAIYSLLRSEFEALTAADTATMAVSDDEVSDEDREEPTMGNHDQQTRVNARDRRHEHDADEDEIEEREEDLDDALDDTFPASDPVSITQPRHHDQDEDDDEDEYEDEYEDDDED